MITMGQQNPNAMIPMKQHSLCELGHYFIPHTIDDRPFRLDLLGMVPLAQNIYFLKCWFIKLCSTHLLMQVPAFKSFPGNLDKSLRCSSWVSFFGLTKAGNIAANVADLVARHLLRCAL